MVNKNVIPFLISLLAALGVAVVAISTPMPVSMKINNEGVLSGYHVQMTNERTGETLVEVTDASGFVLYDWSNSQLGWQSGDVIELSVQECSGTSACVVKKQIDSQGSPIFVTVDLTDSVCPVCEDCQDCPSCPVCDDCDDVDCPTCPDCNVVCPDCTECEDCEECPPATDNSLLGALVGSGLAGCVAVSAFLGRKYVKRDESDDFSQALQTNMADYSGFKAYKSKGKVNLTHMHKGRLGWHDPETEHRDPKWRHEKGKFKVEDKDFGG